jgi:hypothetical protein
MFRARSSSPPMRCARARISLNPSALRVELAATLFHQVDDYPQ